MSIVVTDLAEWPSQRPDYILLQDTHGDLFVTDHHGNRLLYLGRTKDLRLLGDKRTGAEGEPPATTPTDGSPQGQPPQ